MTIPTAAPGRPVLLVLFALAILMGACDSSEDPYLLNPPQPDSTHVRVVNLVADEPIDAFVGGLEIAASVPPLTISDTRQFLFPQQVDFIVRRGALADTLKAQQFDRGRTLTYFALGGGDTSILLVKQTSTVEEESLRSEGLTRLVFINAVADGSLLHLRRDCRTGDTLFRPVPFGANPSLDVSDDSLSLYLFDSGATDPLATARVGLERGRVQYIVAAKDASGGTHLYLLDAATTALADAPSETRTDAEVEVLNALGGGSISVRIGSTQLAANLLTMQLGPPTTIAACSLGNDSLHVSGTGALSIDTVVGLTVGSRNMLVVYGTPDAPGVFVLRRDRAEAPRSSVRIRGVNLLPDHTSAYLEAGAGSPGTTFQNQRLFDNLRYGRVSAFDTVMAGTYPLLIRDAANGQTIGGSVGDLAAGDHTLFIVEKAGHPTIYVTRDDDGSSTIAEFGEPGVPVSFFNVMPDADVTFTVGSLSLPPIAYSYVLQTIVPENVTSISSSVGDLSVDLTSGSYTIGATGSGDAHTAIAVPQTDLPADGKASIRFLNAIPGSDAMAVHEADSLGDVIASTSFGQPSAPISREELKYTFVATPDGSTTVLARATGLQVSAGRRYLFVIAPRRTAGTPEYSVLWLQE